MRNLFLFFVLIFISFKSESQPVFERVYGTSDNETTESVYVNKDRGYVACGQKTFLPAINNHRGFLFRTDSAGSLKWAYNYSSSGPSMYFRDVQQTSDGGFIVVGNKQLTAIDTDLLLLKTDSLGNVAWSVSLGLANTLDAARSVLQTSDGGYVILGETNAGVFGADEVWIIKTDALGNITWSNIYGGTGSDLCFRIKEVPGSGYVVSGHTSSFGLFNDIYVLRIGLSGSLIWSRAFGRSGIESAPGLALTSDGGFMIAAHSNNYNPVNYFKINLLKLKSNGDTAWTKSYYNSGSQSGTGYSVWDITNTSNKSFVISADFNTSPSVYFGSWLKVDSIGNAVWGKTFVTGDGFHSIMETPGKGLIGVGSTIWSTGPGGALDSYLLKTDSTGSWSCIQTADMPLNGSSNPIVQSVPTSTATYGVSNPLAVIRFLDLSYMVNGCDPNSVESYSGESSLNVFPNPSNGRVVINSREMIKSVKVLNELGQIVFENEVVNFKEVTLNMLNNAPGMYFVELQTEKEIRRIKLVKE